MAKAMHSMDLDVLAWNYRGCSGEINRLPRFYHSGATEDLDTIITHALKRNPAYHISLIGFSLGGNLILKFMGERGSKLRTEITGALAISVPLDLAACCQVIDMPSRTVYAQRFLRSLLKKVKDKEAKIPGSMPIQDLGKIKSLRSFDDYITGPLHGFRDAADYYQQCSAIGFLQDIAVPTYIVNAINDPFLAPSCLPAPDRFSNTNLHLLYPKHGGHVGFSYKRINAFNVIENLAIQIWKERFLEHSK
jgi:predicted alpha/beta-fold hydrolase